MSSRTATQIYFADDGAFIARDPTTGYYTLYTPTGTKLVSFDSSGNMRLTGIQATVNGLTLAGQGTPLIVSAPAVGADKSSATTNFINYTPPAIAGVYELQVMVNVTAWTTPATFTIVVTYTDNKGNARTETLAVMRGSTGAMAAAITAVDRWYAMPLLIATDNSQTAITVSTSGTFSGTPVYQIAAKLSRVI